MRLRLTGKLRLFSRDVLVSLRLDVPHGHSPFPLINGNNISQIRRGLPLLHRRCCGALPLSSRKLVLTTPSSSGLLPSRPFPAAPITTTTATITTASPLPLKVSVSAGGVSVSALAVALPVAVPRSAVVIVLAPGPRRAMRRSRALATRSLGPVSVSVSVPVPVPTIR